MRDPSRVTERAYARTCIGTPVDPLSPLACRFCLIGAVIKSTGDNPDLNRFVNMRLRDAIREIDSSVDHTDIPNWFDEQTSMQPTLDAIDLAIERCGGPCA